MPFGQDGGGPSDLLGRVRGSRDRAVAWLLDHIAQDGEPVGARERNGWARVPWALAVCGESAAGAAVVGWAERGQLAPDGNFAAGPAFGAGRFLAYPLAHFAIGAWLLERFETSLASMNALRRMQDPQTGGFAIAPPDDRATDIHDLLSTAQVGLAAVITGQDDIAEKVYRWIADMVDQQPADAGSSLYTFRQGATLLTKPDDPLRWLAITDFSKPRQTYYTPGMAAVFLAAYAQRQGLNEPITLAAKLLARNIGGTRAQFEDAESVQICKFGWGVAAMHVADPGGGWLPHVERMGQWFIDHQGSDGSWAPSTFLAPEPSDIDKLVKTAEHVMELNALMAALGAAAGRATAATPAMEMQI